MAYRVFTRRWWKDNSDWPNGLEPDGTGRKRTIKVVQTEDEARRIAQEHNRTTDPGRYSIKAEFERV